MHHQFQIKIPVPELNDISAIVLAAGMSQRFGSEKLLHPVTLHGITQPLAAHTLLQWLEVFDSITVVVRQDSGDFCTVIETALGTSKAKAIRWVECVDAANGMSASLACGVRTNRNSQGWLIGLADMPLVPTSVIVSVRNALLSGAQLAAPAYAGRRGHPVGFASLFYPGLPSLQGDSGARFILEKNRNKIVLINTDDAGVIADIDVPDDVINFNNLTQTTR